ncbi:MAG: SDR family oxidoreductase, partial [Bdellovibrionales bacterium]|nr:SDR family oxidoreductase [Bdellovibrionales bacterium]
AVPPKVVLKVFETNTLAPLRLCQALVPLMNAQGCIVNVSSGMGSLHDMGGSWPGYRISKAGLNALTRILAAELSTTGIRVNAVCPGWVRTSMGGSQATRSVEEGAETIVWAACLPADGQTGGFFRDKKAVPW